MTCKGGFDNGLVSEHEHTANCRLCLLERITELTAEVGRRVSDNLQHREREVALHARVQELERENGILRTQRDGWTKASDEAHKRIGELERKRDEARAQFTLIRSIKERIASLREGTPKKLGYGNMPVERRDDYSYDMEYEAALPELEWVLKMLEDKPRA